MMRHNREMVENAGYTIDITTKSIEKISHAKLQRYAINNNMNINNILVVFMLDFRWYICYKQ